MRSHRVWRRLPELVGEDAEFLPSGHLRVCFRNEEAAALEAHVAGAREYGLELELLSGNALRVRFPYVAADAVAACYAPGDGHANPRLAAPALARAARREGATVHENTEVASIHKPNQDFLVETILRPPLPRPHRADLRRRLGAGTGRFLR